MKRVILMIILCNFFIVHGQVIFDNEIVFMDDSHFSFDVTDIISSDLNNDGYNDLIISAAISNSIIWYENHNGNLQYKQRHLLADSLNNPASIFSADLDQDGYNDIITASFYGDKVVWFKNLGDNSFGLENILIDSIDGPVSVCADDVNMDGKIDIIAGIKNNPSVLLFLNLGEGNFLEEQLILSSNNSIKKVVLSDLNNDDFPDLISIDQNGSIQLSKNTTHGVFDSPISISYGDDFAFLDINQDGLLDLVTINEYSNNLKYSLNIDGENFSDPINIDSSIADPHLVKVADMDEDSIPDIILATWSTDAIVWYKNNNDETFAEKITISTNTRGTKAIIINDLNLDGLNEIICSSNNSSEIKYQKTSIFSFDSISNSYLETVINYYLGASSYIKSADMNNDGFMDIISGYRGLTLNIGLGNNEYSAQLLLTDIANANFTKDFDMVDMDNDGLKDIVCLKSIELIVLKNNGNNTFSLAYSIPVNHNYHEIEVTDIDGNGNPDILFSSTGNNMYLGLIRNSGGNVYEPIEKINFTEYEFRPYNLCSADIDLDGDKDIVFNSYDFNMINWVENVGTNDFIYHQISYGEAYGPILLADFDRDGFIDLLCAGQEMETAEKLYWLKNNNGTFSNPQIIDVQSGMSLACGDINDDEYVDIVGVAWAPVEVGYSTKLYYYLNNGGVFGEQEIIDFQDNNNYSIQRPFLADLNNDHNLDILVSHSLTEKTGIFLNTLPLDANNLKDESTPDFEIFPNPVSDQIFWKENTEGYNITVYNLMGSIVLEKANYQGNSLALNLLPNGTYYIKFQDIEKIFIKRIIKI